MEKDVERAREDDDTRRDAAVERFLVSFGNLVDRVTEVDSKPRDFGTGAVLHRAEIHTVQAIGRRPGLNLTSLADEMEVTKGAASQMVSRLARKGLVRKSPSPEARREVMLELTELGWTAYREHERHHERMSAAVRAHYGDEVDERVAEATRVLRDLMALVGTYERMQRG